SQPRGTVAVPKSEETEELRRHRQALKAHIVDVTGCMPQYVADASGTAEGSRMAFDIAGRGARGAGAGVTPRSISPPGLILKGLSVFGIGGGVGQQRVLDLQAAGKLDMSGCISHHYPFSRLHEAFERMRTDPEAVRIGIHLDQ